MSWKVTFNLRIEPSTLRIIRKLAAEAAKAEGMSSIELNAFELAVGEALTGAYYTHGPDAPLEVEMEFDGLSLIITLRSNGSASTEESIEPVQSPRQLEPEPAYLTPEGRLSLLQHLVDRVEIIRADSSGQPTVLRLRKKLL